MITHDLVLAEVQRFWNALIEKRADELAGFYAPDATVFGSASRRAEPGRMAAARRLREYFASETAMRFTMGLVDVQLLADTVAVATYNFDFHAERRNHRGAPDEHIIGGRCSQVFVVDPDGELKIVHEHISLAS